METQTQQSHRPSTALMVTVSLAILVVILAGGYLYVNQSTETAMEDTHPMHMMEDHTMSKDMHMEDGHSGHDMLVNEKGQMYQHYFSGEKRLTDEERQRIIDTVPMPVIGAVYGNCYDSDADALESKYYSGTTEYTHKDGRVEVQKDQCTSDTNLTEYYCTRIIEDIDNFYLRSWEYECEKGCSDGACVFIEN